MGFTDLLSSSRGPGVIGTLLALLVLVGFGTLYMFVFDEGLQGGKQTIESVVRNQASEIETLHIQIKNSTSQMEEARQRKAVVKEAEELETRAEITGKRIAELNAAKEAATNEVAAATKAWEDYKEEYRVSEWAAAKGEKLGDLKTLSGKVYRDAVISAVDHTGMRINSPDGLVNIDTLDMPQELQDRFQFSDEIKEAVLTERGEEFIEHSNNVEIAQLAKKGTDKLASIKQMREEIVEVTANVRRLKSQLPRQQAAVDRMRIAIATEKSKKSGISRAPEMSAKLKVMDRAMNDTRRAIPTNERKVSDHKRQIQIYEREVGEIKRQIEEIKKSIADKQAATPQP